MSILNFIKRKVIAKVIKNIQAKTKIVSRLSDGYIESEVIKVYEES